MATSRIAYTDKIQSIISASPVTQIWRHLDANEIKTVVNNNADEIDAIAAGNVTKVGTPVNDQLGVWTGDGTIEGDPNLRFASNQIRIDVAGGTESVRIKKDLLQFYSPTVEIIAFGALTSAGFLNIKDSSSNNVATLSGTNESNFLKGLTLEDTKAVHHDAHIQLTQGQIQAINSTPIELVAAPGAGKYIQIMSGSIYLDHNGTTYAAATNVVLSINSVTVLSSSNTFVIGTVDRLENLHNSLSNNLIAPNTALMVTGGADATGAGGTIDVYLQYVIIDTN